MSKGFIVGNSGGAILYSISCVYPEGSILTCKDEAGSIELKASNTKGLWIFSLPFPGKWTVTSVDPSDSAKNKSQTVEITQKGQNVSVKLSYRKWLFEEGVGAYVDFKNTSQKNVSYSLSTSAITVNGVVGTYNGVGVATADTIDVSAFDTLYVDINVAHKGTHDFLIGMSASQLGGATATSSYAAYTSLGNGRGTYSVDISKLSGNYYFSLAAAYAHAAVYDIYLE